ncbi:helix-turn-helix domain-containing protein [Rhizobium rhizogenes]|uniref:helix-turn-helix domain-containing protein n=1 Tax=Rhizobium rhizogenes TaxID=359 RepID=UPI0004D40ACF|nr:helix-turn-helix domain-containing protein [Rhizobium rhizogenes]KEA07142.1 hypothetical protein CN09_09355 [Rhizobium rhizogenes]NTF67955.1 hypothetical protein [Rhizobium rhizogenes]NTI80423.1 hypothetical protein [Rhizobium rhizogenes]NTJ22609.1 hypothetical protein [Rhizobium rhizogenes]QUE81315.1 hypothetical protein EML492_05765 [Rhizobium rhizogenes]
MMQLEAKTFTTGADLIASYNAVTKRLRGKPMRVVVPVVCEAPKPVKPRLEPELPNYPKAYIKLRAGELGFSYEDIISIKTKKLLVEARHQLIAEVKEKFGLSLGQTARHFGDRDHTSVMNALRRNTARQTQEGQEQIRLREERLVAMGVDYASEMPLNEVSQKYGISEGHLIEMRRLYGWPMRRNRKGRR